MDNSTSPLYELTNFVSLKASKLTLKKKSLPAKISRTSAHIEYWSSYNWSNRHVNSQKEKIQFQDPNQTNLHIKLYCEIHGYWKRRGTSIILARWENLRIYKNEKYLKSLFPERIPQFVLTQAN